MRPFVALLLVSCLAAAEDDWRKGKLPKELDGQAVAQLAKHKVLIGRMRFKQVFTPYISSELPLFITSDCVLNAFHVLFEESVARLEKRREQELAKHLRTIRKRVKEVSPQFKLDEALKQKARKRAERILDVALGLLGDKVSDAIAADVKLVEGGRGRHKPEWLGPPDAGFESLDYARFRPRSFYTRTESLQRYYRATAWLQAIPFRADPAEETVAFLMLNRVVTGLTGGTDGRAAARFLLGFEHLLPSGDDLTIVANVGGGWPMDPDDLERTRKQWRTGGGELNDQIARRPSGVTARILPAARLSDAVLFQRMLAAQQPVRGLQVCALLGSDWARGRLGEAARKVVEGTELSDGENIYDRYLDCLKELVNAPEPDAPKFMSTDPWRIKSCHTLLGGWAQMRHTWALQAKPVAHYLGMGRTEPGYVEPDPEFFAQLAGLADATKGVFNLHRVFSLEFARVELGRTLKAADAILKRLDPKDKQAFRRLSGPEQEALYTASIVAYALGHTEEDPKAIGKFVGTLWPKLEQTGQPLDAKLQEIVEGLRLDLSTLWNEFNKLCLVLQSLAHKQLRGVAFNARERHDIKTFGQQLARLMLYRGNSYLTPQDDAPRVAEVAFDPARNRRRHVGVARARVLYVLYPTKDGEVLCRGSVLAYHEFDSPGPLTDAEWRKLLDSPNRPAAPAWLEPIAAPGELLPLSKR